MNRTVKFVLISAGIIVFLMIAANIAFVRHGERLKSAYSFAVNEPEAAQRQISEAAERTGSLAGSGVGVKIPGKNAVGPNGSTQWTVSPDGVIRGTAPDRGLTVLLTPEMQEKKVVWRCKVEPERGFLRGTCGVAVQSERWKK